MSTSNKPFTHAPAFDISFLQVSPIHKICVFQYGLPTGKPALFLPGGPGGALGPWAAQYFDPSIYRVIMIEQRGIGQSTPLGELHDNTTAHLLSDIETVRTYLGIAKWHVVWGGSWGSTMALLYAQAHPELVGSLVLRGVWAVSEEETRATVRMMEWLWPEVWETTMLWLRPEEREKPVKAFYERMMQGDRAERLEAARRYSFWPVMMSQLTPPEEGIKVLDHEDPDVFLANSLVNAWFISNGCWVREGQILEAENMRKIEHIPAHIVNGRYDMMCPTFMAKRVHEAMAKSKLWIIEAAGHTAREPSTEAKLIEVTNEFGKLDF